MAVSHQLEVDLDSGATDIKVIGVALSTMPVRATVVGAGGPADSAPHADAGIVHVKSATGSDAEAMTVELNTDVTWRIDIRGGSSRLSLDLSNIKMNDLRIGGGATTMTVTLAAPIGTVPISITGGANGVSFHVLHRVPYKVQLSPSVAHAIIDGTSYSASSSVRTYSAPQYGDSRDRYTIDMEAGAATLTVDST